MEWDKDGMGFVDGAGGVGSVGVGWVDPVGWIGFIWADLIRAGTGSGPGWDPGQYGMGSSADHLRTLLLESNTTPHVTGQVPAVVLLICCRGDPRHRAS